MRISDLSSDVCSSDLRTLDQRRLRGQKFRRVVRVQPITRRLIELAPGRALAIDDDIHAERIDPRLRERNVEAIRLEVVKAAGDAGIGQDRKSTRLNSSH